MYLPPLQPVANSDIRICGDVEIHPTASIAPGVILQAAPNSRIIIGIDACIGMGVIISAYGGVVEIANGVTLGSGVLIVGQSQVGSNACVGTATTIFNASVDAMAVVTPGSIIGDSSRPEAAAIELDVSWENTAIPNQTPENITEVDEILKSSVINNNAQEARLEKKPINPTDRDLEEPQTIFNGSTNSDDHNDPWTEKKLVTTDLENAVDLTVKEIEKSIKVEDKTTIGKVYIDQLLVTLFSHKKHSNNNSSSETI
jgi:carbon dioxide concentrating mechanism protein CcmN